MTYDMDLYPLLSHILLKLRFITNWNLEKCLPGGKFVLCFL